MTNVLIGRSPLTTIAGYILAILTGIHQAGTPGAHNWQDFLLPAAIALFGRLAADDRRKKPSAPAPSLVPDAPELQPDTEPASFLRRGRQQRQKRSSDGRFAPAVA